MRNSKLLALFLISSTFLCFSACIGKNFEETNTTSENTLYSEHLYSDKFTLTESSNKDILTSKQSDFTDTDVGGVDEEELYSPYDEYKYRAVYYSIAAPFVDLVDEDVYWNWLKNETPYRNFPIGEVEEMAMVAFIKKFNISRTEFDKANEEYKKILLEYGGIAVMNPAKDNPNYDRNIECSEIYNADIIYTFDNEIINNYYLYVDPEAQENSTAELSNNTIE